MLPSRLIATLLLTFLVGIGRLVGAPTVSVQSPAPGSTVAALTQIAVTFSEAVSGVDGSDLVINNAAAAAVSGSGAGPYTFTFTQPAPGAVTVQFDYDHGIAGLGTGAFVPAGSWSYTLTDTIPPTVGSLTPAAGSTAAPFSQAEITFSERVTGVNASDLSINGASATNISGTDSGPYLFTFPQPPPGTVNFAWNGGHGIADTAGNPFAGGSWAVTLAAAGAGNLVITEMLAANVSGLADENAEFQDWIEIQNAGGTTVNLTGWALTNDADELARWIFPNWTLNPGEYLVVFASGKDRKPAQVTAGRNNTVAQGRLHTNFKLNQFGDYLGLAGPGSPRTAVSQFPANYNPNGVPPVTEFPAQRNNFSYGPQPEGALRYFATPTPGVANGTSSLTAITPRPNFSVNRGTFADPFQLVLSCPDPSATIRYTTDFSEPTAASPAYTAPITVSTTAIVRAAAFGANAIASETVTHSYVFLDQVLTQPANPVGFPASWGVFGGTTFSPGSTTPGLVPADYGMDPEIVNDPAVYDGKTNLQRIKDGLRDLPVMSVTMTMGDIFTVNNTGIYSQPTTHGVEKPCSVEMIRTDGSTLFAETAGIQIQGNASREQIKNPRHGFKLLFKGDYGKASLNAKLFDDSPVESHDDIVLRADFNFNWRHWDANQRLRGTHVRDEWLKSSFRDMGQLASHSGFVHLFINGLYWGVYDPTEQPTDQFAENYLGGLKEEYDVINEGAVKSGNITAYNAMISVPNLSLNSNYEALKQLLDVEQYIDYMLLHFFIGHEDWGQNKNWYAIRRRVPGGKFMFLPWDGENILGSNAAMNRVSNTDTTSYLHNSPSATTNPRLKDNAEYRLTFADRVHKHMVAPNGALQPAATIGRMQYWLGQIDDAMAAESARWGDYRRDVHNYQSGPYQLYTRNNQWKTEIARLTTGPTAYLATRTGTVLGQLRSALLYPTLNAAEFRNNADNALVTTFQVPAGFALKMTLPTPPPAGTTSAGTIHYTTDGTDPRVAFTGAVAAGALTYTGPLTINVTTTVKARVLNGTTWSALHEQTFVVGLDFPSVRITEIMYHPPAANGGEAAEFIELQNAGPRTVDLSNWYFEGVDHVFSPGTLLRPGNRLVLASDSNAVVFAAQYPGVAVAGYFDGSLDNDGERLALIDARGRTIESVNFDDLAPWPTSPDGGGYSLERIDPLGDPDDPFNWKASAAVKGTPGLANSLPATPAVVISEVLAKNVSAVNVGGAFPDYVELRNVTGTDVDLSGWSLITTNEFAFPPGTMIEEGERLVVYCDNAGGPGLHTGSLPLNDASGMILLKQGATIADAVRYGNQAANYAIGRVTTGGWTLVTPSPGGANSAAATALLSNLALNEWLANPPAGAPDWLELYNLDAALPLALRGVFVQSGAEVAQIGALAFLEPRGFLQLFCEEEPGVDQLDLRLPAAGSTLALFDPGGAEIETVTFGPQSAGISQGRLPDGTGALTAFPGSSSPGAPNYVINYAGPVLHEVLARNVAGAQAPWGTHADWVEFFNPNGAAFNLGGMKLGTTASGANAWIIPAGTSVPANGYLAIWCDPARLPSTGAGADLNTGFGLGDASGELYLFNAAGQVANQIAWSFQVIDRSIGLEAGTWKLLANPTRGGANTGPAVLGVSSQLRINEWAAALNGQTDWFELYNLDGNPVEMTGLYLSDDPSEIGRTKFQIPPLSFIGGRSWVKWEADDAPEFGRNHVNFNLSAGAESLRLSRNDAALGMIDAVSFGAQSASTTEGRVPDGQTISAGLTPTPGARNFAPGAPSFASPPLTQTVAQGSDVTFSVSVTGTEPITFEWRFNGGAIPGASGASLMLDDVLPAHDGVYTCVATNSFGAVESPPARLIVTQSFAQWAATNGLSGGNAGPTADADLDGLANLVEFFHHLDPTSPGGNRSGLPEAGRESGPGQPTYLTLTYQRNPRASSTTVEHQLATTPAGGAWVTVTPDVTENLPPDLLTGDPRVRVKFIITGSEPNKFVRLLLTP